MPGESLVKMSSHRATKSKLSVGQPDLYLIVSLPRAWLVLEGITDTNKSEEDTIYEQDILRDPGNIKHWLAYLDFKFRHGSLHEQAFVLERACFQLPRSYKLWKMVCRIPSWLL